MGNFGQREETTTKTDDDQQHQRGEENSAAKNWTAREQGGAREEAEERELVHDGGVGGGCLCFQNERGREVGGANQDDFFLTNFCEDFGVGEEIVCKRRGENRRNT